MADSALHPSRGSVLYTLRLIYRHCIIYGRQLLNRESVDGDVGATLDVTASAAVSQVPVANAEMEKHQIRQR